MSRKVKEKNQISLWKYSENQPEKKIIIGKTDQTLYNH